MNWDDTRYFLAVAREGQMLGAARRLGVSQALLSRHIASLEAAVGSRLMDRTTRGCALTEAGQTLLEIAERVEAEMLGAAALLNGTTGAVNGTIRIGAPDGFGSAFLAPRLGELRALYPDLRVQLVPLTRSLSLSQREADLAIMVGRPTRGRLRVRRLTDYSLGLYASEGYLRREGIPQTSADLASHSKIGYVDDLVHTSDMQYASEFLGDWRSDIEIATAIGQLEAIRAGAGIGVMHDFMAGQHDELRRVLPEMAAHRTYWIVWHENMRAVQRVRVVADFLDRITREARSTFIAEQRVNHGREDRRCAADGGNSV